MGWLTNSKNWSVLDWVAMTPFFLYAVGVICVHKVAEKVVEKLEGKVAE